MIAASIVPSSTRSFTTMFLNVSTFCFHPTPYDRLKLKSSGISLGMEEGFDTGFEQPVTTSTNNAIVITTNDHFFIPNIITILSESDVLSH